MYNPLHCTLLYYGLITAFLVEYSYKGDVNLTHLFCLKDANGSEVPTTVEHALFPVGMYLLDPFLMKRRSLLDVVASELVWLTTSLSLTPSMGSLSPSWCFLDLFRCFSSSFTHLFGLFSLFPKLEFRELLYLLHKTLVSWPPQSSYQF